jgi:hypothetical protein
VEDSAPRVTVHVVPETFVTATISEQADGFESTTWNWVGGVAVEEAAANRADDATVHVCTVPEAGAVVPPETTVVDAWFVNSSVATPAPLSLELCGHAARG